MRWVRKKAGDGKVTGTKPISSSLRREKFKTISNPNESLPRPSRYHPFAVGLHFFDEGFKQGLGHDLSVLVDLVLAPT
jgi:hypothetical protein